MRTLRNVCLWAAGLALCLALASPASIVGTWEGSLYGAKAVTLKITERDNRIGGSVIFYIIHDSGSGIRDGSPSPDTPLDQVQWDGERLRFSVVNMNGETVRFEFRPTEAETGKLSALNAKGEPERSVDLTRRK